LGVPLNSNIPEDMDFLAAAAHPVQNITCLLLKKYTWK